jgi:16S rRNA (cytidine1402-2'-O)-methyltransferase
MTTVLYESPNRLSRLLRELEEEAGSERAVCVCRELTKLHEEHIRGTVGQVRAVVDQRASVKGEIVVVIGPASGRGETASGRGETASGRGETASGNGDDGDGE